MPTDAIDSETFGYEEGYNVNWMISSSPCSATATCSDPIRSTFTKIFRARAFQPDFPLQKRIPG